MKIGVTSLGLCALVWAITTQGAIGSPLTHSANWTSVTPVVTPLFADDNGSSNIDGSNPDADMPNADANPSANGEGSNIDGSNPDADMPNAGVDPNQGGNPDADMPDAGVGGGAGSTGY